MRKEIAVLAVFLALATTACAHSYSGFGVEVLVDGRAAPVYSARGVQYIEAIKGKEYSIRLRNPLGVRVAVALSVDGLNSIDARHTDSRSAQKWVLAPYETITISGWQTSMSQARHFFFTSEENSYGQWLGKTENLGIISAAFFRERVPPPPAPRPIVPAQPRDSGKMQQQGPRATPEAKRDADTASAHREQPAVPERQEEYAATGIGDRYGHQVHRVRMELEDRPVATVSIRYEYRPQLVRLGVLPPAPARYPDPLARRQKAHGFDGGFCPDPR